MSFQTLSINNEPEPQGYEQEQFDIILAANVMHATSDISNALSHTKS